jgi:hypothetical protein
MRKLEETLRKSEMAIKDLDYEVAHIIDTDGNLIHVENGQRYEVDPPAALVKGNILTHNHPSGECFFSLDDIRLIIEEDGYELRAVTQDGRFVSFKKAAEATDTTIADNMENAELYGIKLFLSADKRAISIYGINRTTEQLIKEAENIVNEWLTNNAPKHGYIFTQGVI